MNNNAKISPSILSANFANLGSEITKITEAGADYIHIDVMDGHFVPNITMGSKIIGDVRKFSPLPFDVHLMISNPDQYIEEFAQSGSDIITIHLEATTHVYRTISLIKSFNKKAGISIIPSTPPEQLDYILEQVDLVLIMTVNPGFGGQEFLTSQLKKIDIIRNRIDQIGLNIDIEVDGGINNITAKECISAGANILVSGSYIFKNGAKFYKDKIDSLR